MPLLPEELVRQIHAAASQVVLVLNGGSRAVADLLEMPGGSKILLEATVPYAEGALRAWLGSRPEQFCSSRTARAMAVVAFGRAVRYGAAEHLAAGVSCTAGLATDRPKRGSHRAHIAVQTASQTRHWSLELTKDARSRQEEERIVSRMVLNAVAAACGLAAQLELPLLELERVEIEDVSAPLLWQDLFLGRVEAIQANQVMPWEGEGNTLPSPPAPLPVGEGRNAPPRPAPLPEGEERKLPSPPLPLGEGRNAPRVIFSGAFDPLHDGHRRMAEIAEETLGLPVAMEISILNVDKPALDYLELDRRLKQFTQRAVWLTRAATFHDKSRLFPGATFVVGIDTLRRIADPRYYGNDGGAMMQSIERIIARGCRFLVFGRAAASSLIRLLDLDLPDVLRRACREIPPETFREDVSSTALRKAGAAPE
jgi:nicotinamide mononucleotide (NMN) deamidase PncC